MPKRTDLDWTEGAGVPIPEEARNRWAEDNLYRIKDVNEQYPVCTYTYAGECMVIAVRFRDGSVSVFDCIVRRRHDSEP